MKQRFLSVSAWAKKYLSWPTIICLIGLAYIIFLGEHTVFRTIDYDTQIDSLRNELAAQTDTMLYYRDLNRRLTTDPELMEQVVREQYNMKRDNEDVYIFQPADK